MSIVPDKYKGKYKGPSDWLGHFINDQAYSAKIEAEYEVTKNEDGSEKKTLKRKAVPAKLDVSKLFALAHQNGLKTDKYGTAAENEKNGGRMRMTIGNMLRAEAKARHGLVDLAGNFVEADADFIGDHVKTKNADGSKIVTAKAAETKEAA